MARPRFTVTSTRFSDSEDDDDELLPRTDSMRHDSIVKVGNRTKHATRYVQVEASPGKRQRIHSPEPDLLVPDIAPPTANLEDFVEDLRVLEEGFAFDEGHPVDSGPRGVRESDRPLNMWAQYDRETFLDELLRCEGRGDYHGQKRCAECHGWGTQAHRCEECFTGALFCTPCLVSIHADNPLHFVQTWNGSFFERNTLRNLGLRIQLGHIRGEACPRTLARSAEETSKASFCIVHTNGIHEVALDFCICGKAQSHTVQLLRARLYPATTLRPSSAASFSVLRKFHMHSFESKCSAYEFYNALARETNNTGNFQPRDRYREFLRMTREWRNLQMLKRSARAHIPEGVRNIEAGACALLFCPACPQPGKNLPVDGDWNEVAAYMEHVREHWDFEQEVRIPFFSPDRDARGTASSGIGTVDCARHNMKRPNGVGDLQKGERYINMDYMLWKSLQGYDDLIQLIFSYDIVCQWSINIWRRLAQYKPELKNRAGTGYRYWPRRMAKPRSVAGPTRILSQLAQGEMGPGARRDILDDHFNNWNHKKIVALGRVMLERVQKAVGQMMEKQEDLVETEASLPPENVKNWTMAIELWEHNPRNPNPFDIKEKHATLQAVRKRIAEETKDAVEGDRADDVRGDLHVSEMLAMGMQLESQQRDLASDGAALKTHASDGQKTTLLERGNKLRRKIASWVRTQTEFQPDVARLRERDDLARAESAKTQPTAGVSVEALELWLPSKQARTPGVIVKQSHARYEFDMREARAYEALEEIRRLLLVRTHHYKFKDKNVSGVSGHTRSRQAIAVLDERIRREAGEYRAARRALASLAPRLGETRWSLILKELAPKDIRVLQGIGSGGIQSLTAIVVADLVPLKERGLFNALIGATFSITTAAGPFIGGAIVQRTTWRWLFYINLPMAVAAFVAVFTFLQLRHPPRPNLLACIASLDLIGNIMIIGSATSCIIALTWAGITYAWTSVHILVPLCIGIMGLFGAFLYEMFCSTNPSIPRSILSNRTSLSGYISSFIHGLVITSVAFYLPVYFQAAKDAVPVLSGLYVFPMAVFISPLGYPTGTLYQQIWEIQASCRGRLVCDDSWSWSPSRSGHRHSHRYHSPIPNDRCLWVRPCLLHNIHGTCPLSTSR
ncbi:CxC2 domain-containing protein [Mycena sanguinolenta]|uniref:CxC2 domain-containing protein n=1 Tax=Mycena sanguinolenta TaxID=230812 RepID=A0A8H6TWI0_9AGAR|nr:CxC2 domain-containing protein [Mycena sanguinolenta]